MKLRKSFAGFKSLTETIKNLLAKEQFVTKKASIFEEEDIKQFLRIDTDSDWMASLMMVAIHGHYGGNRCTAEMKSLTYTPLLTYLIRY